MAIVPKTQHRVLSDFVKPCGHKWVKLLSVRVLFFMVKIRVLLAKNQ
jgi:hypothetical protein